MHMNKLNFICEICLDAQKDASQAKKTQTESSAKAAVQSNSTDKGQKADGTSNAGKNATGDKHQPGGNNKSRTNQPGPTEKQKETTPSPAKSTASGNDCIIQLWFLPPFVTAHLRLVQEPLIS